MGGCLCKKSKKEATVLDKQKSAPVSSTVPKTPHELSIEQKLSTPKSDEITKTANKGDEESLSEAKTQSYIAYDIASDKSIYDELPDDKMTRAMIEFINDTTKKGITGLKSEFEKIEVPEPQAHDAYDNNLVKNHHPDIPCFDHNRVKLHYDVPPESDYIHANRIETKLTVLKNKFICTQAPIPTTVNDFWRMVMQEEPRFIIMLCNNIEHGKLKCMPYFPSVYGESSQFGQLKVIHYGEDEKGSETAFDIKLLKVRKDEKSVVVKHCCFRDWPDLGVPTSGLGLWRILRKIDMEKGTAIIHCSSGIGRTGLLMTAEILLKGLYDGNYIKVPEIVKELRTQRHGMVQSSGQYIYMHFAICTFLEMKLATNPKATPYMARLDQFLKDYQEYAKNEENADMRKMENKKRPANDTPKPKRPDNDAHKTMHLDNPRPTQKAI